jgi:DHA2 family multidrug resistance protein-like MFS transporter
MVTPMIVRRFRPAYVMAVGSVLGAIGLAMLTQVDAGSSIGVIVASSIVFSLGLAPVFTLATDMMIGTAPPERAGAAAAISETGAELGGALGIAILGSIGAVIYRSRMSSAIPSSVEPQLAEDARSTLGGALAAASELPLQLGNQLLDAGRDAFVEGLQLMAAVSTVAALAMAVIVVVLLRHVEPHTESDLPDQEPEGVAAVV